MNLIQEKRKEISNVIESYRNCQVVISNEEKQIYYIVSKSDFLGKKDQISGGEFSLEGIA